MTITDILEVFDSLEKKKFDEQDVCLAIRPFTELTDGAIDEKLLAEYMAFNFGERDQNQKMDSYFVPSVVFEKNDGTIIESPSIEEITPNYIEYWEKRVHEVCNPILRARYSGLVFNFKNEITGKKPSHEICKLCIESLAEIADGDFHKYNSNTIIKLKRALTLAVTISNVKLISLVKDTVINFERRHALEDKSKLRGYAFDLLVGNKNVTLGEEEEESIIRDLEEKLDKATTVDDDKQKIDPWAAEAAAARLAAYYRKRQRNDDVKRVILAVGEAYSNIIGDVSALQSSGLLQHLHKLYLKFNLNSEAEELLLRIHKLGHKVASELKPISQAIKMPKEKLEEYISHMTNGSLQEIISRIALTYIPQKEKEKERVLEFSKKAGLFYLLTQKIQDQKGRVIATIGPLEQDLEGHIVRQVSQSFSYYSIFLRAVLKEAVEKKGLSKAEIIFFLEKIPIINKDRSPIIERALDAYFKNDYLVFTHLIIPQIEEAIRNLLETLGSNPLKSSRSGGFHLKTFDEILREKVIVEFLGDDFTNYYRVLFTDQRGWNLRNSVCHGMVNLNKFDSSTSDRLLHSLICLGLIGDE